ncbi:MAG: thiolase family protein [Novosphingobium sp.]|nr:thiolase family protein [Novosphingobium sp.]
MSGTFEARNKVAIVGYAQSQVVRRPTEPLGVTTIRTAREAIADAGLKPQQIDGFAASALMPTSGGHEAQDGISTVSPAWLAEHLGIEPAYAVGFQGHGQLTGSLTLAVNAVASGAADYVLLHRALHNPPAGKYNDNPMTEAAGMMQWCAPQGFFGGLPAIAMVYTEYCQRYGATREAMAHVVTEARNNGAKLPWSYWHGKPITTENYLAEPVIVDPMCRLDCDIPVQGVGVFILTSAERAKDLPNKPVYMSGYANGYPQRHRLPLHWTLDDMEEAGQALSARLWEAAGISREEINLVQPYDAFSPFVYIWLEALGFTPLGEAHRFILDGGIDASRPNSIAALSGGGAIGNGRLHGLPQLLECYLQLSGRAGQRQRNVSNAVFSYSAPYFGGAAVLTNTP